MSNKLIDIVNISKAFDENVVLDELNLYIRENEFLTLLGPSGCGKTTLLRILGGFETPDSGKIIFDGQDITNLAPNKRQLNTVFQKYALFTHMTIAENIAFGLKIKGKSQNYINDKIRYALKLVNLEGFENRTPASLSGGQQQRIAIARAIVNEPKVLLLDEPLGALDLKLRQDMQYELIRLKNELGITFIYVTHDQEEALTMSDTIVVMNQGYIQQVGTPEDIYNEPKNAFVADFIGDSNILSATMVHDRLVNILGANFPCVDEGFGQKKPVDAVIRPEDIDLVKPEDGIIRGVVTHVIFKGVHYEMEVMANNYEWLVHSTDMFPVGAEVGLRVDPFDIQIMKNQNLKMRRRYQLKNSKLLKQMLAGPYLLWSAAFIIIPLIMVFYYGLTNNDGGFTMMNLARITEPENLKALGLALLLSLVSTIICLILAYPLAMILTGLGVNQSSFIVLIFILPMWMNSLLRIIAWQNLLEKNGVINSLLHFFHLPALEIINTPYAIVLGMVYDFLPFMILPIYNVLSKIDTNVIEAARDLGANSVQTFTKILLPLSVPGIISGITMVFVPSLTTFVISDLLGGSKILLIGNVIEQEFKQGSNWHSGSGMSLVLMIFILISMALIAKYDKDGEGTTF